MLSKRLAFLAMAIAVMGLARPAAAATPDGINWSMNAAAIHSSCDAAIAKLHTRLAAIVHAHGKRTFANTILAFEDATADLNDTTVAQTFLLQVSPDKSVRDAALACVTAEQDVYAVLSADPQLYRAMSDAATSNTAKSVYDRKLVDLTLIGFKRSGAALTPAKRKEFVALENELTDLQNHYQQNLAEDHTTITITQKQTDGIPADMLAGYKRAANGDYIVPVNESTGSFSSYAANDDARKLYYMAYNTRQAKANTALLERAIAVRDRLAHLLGYETWADYQLADRMAQSPARVDKFMMSLDRTIMPKAQADIEELRALKAAETHNPNAELHQWDVGRYMHQLNKTKYSVDSNAIRQYFPVQHTIDAVLRIYHTLLGVDFTPVTPAAAWAPDVFEYRVNDTMTGKLLGYTYFDLYPRAGKYDHFANFPIVPVRKTGDASRAPISAIVGNWPKPSAGHPALLSHDDVVTFFHEFGHNMAALLTTAPYETLSSGFRQDFVEAPSQMLENFVWQPSVLKEISSNVTTGQPLPDDLIAKMEAARYVDYAYDTTRQIMLSLVDMRYHSMGPHVDTTSVWATTAKEVSPMPMYPGTAPQASFGHLMGGYDAGYYSYLWAKVYAQDMFTAFQTGGLENPQVGMRYRTTILAPARTFEPDVEVRNFLGRPMSPNAFYAEFGITPQATPSSTGH